MFIGHFGVGLAARKLAPYSSLGTLVLAAQLVDLIWPTFLLLGIERVRIEPGATRVTPLAFEYYPWTHSLLMGVAWAAAIGGVYAFFRRYPKGAWVVFGAVISHWVLDLIVHRPDLTLAPGLPRPLLGLGLWNSLTGTLTAEFAIFLGGLWIYATNTEARDAIGRYGLLAFALALCLIYGANLAGPPPPSAQAIAIVGHAQWLLVVWAIWVDRHRRSFEL